MYQFYRIKCSFIYKGGIKVEGRICFEMAQTKDEAEEKATKYLESWGYTNISIDECRPETEEEKYKKEFEKAAVDKVSVPVEVPQPRLEASAAEDSDELF